MMSKKRLVALTIIAVSFVLLGRHIPAQEKSVKPGINDPFKNPDVNHFIQRFERESREIYEHRHKIVSLCKLKPGMAVADIGAGTGLFTRLFAEEVGPAGKVYAVEIVPAFIEHILASSKVRGFKNVVGVLCDQHSTKLPPNSVDLVFICDTYHHFEFPFHTLESIHQALKPGGQLVLIDFKRIKGVTSEKIWNHVRAGQEVFTKEVRSSSFQQMEEVTFLKENYFVRFQKTERKSK